MSLNLEETFREFAGEAASGLGTDAAPEQAATAETPTTNAAAAPAKPVQGASEDDAGEAVVSKNFKIMGDLNCHDVLRIEGYVEGNIECRSLTVSESARIKGNIRAKTVIMSGKVIGTIEAGTLTLNRPAIVAGDLVVHDQLGIEPGAHFEGSCKRVSAKKAAQTKQAAQAAPAAKQTTGQAPTPQAPTSQAQPAPAAAAE
ncbi:MAG: polymer-forming cytoskeletal protein [Alphaproteobacteria bacterium]|nr:polymer-forming cytoskeletal protein [Alphaproteobacteria bacterium]